MKVNVRFDDGACTPIFPNGLTVHVEEIRFDAPADLTFYQGEQLQVDLWLDCIEETTACFSPSKCQLIVAFEGLARQAMAG